MNCPLCLTTQPQRFCQDTRRHYWRCQECALVFVDPQQLPSAEQEQREYALHQNDLQDAGYRRFLERLAQPLLAALSDCATGLDFGCGPAPLLAQMLSEEGRQVQLYDPFYAATPEVLQTQYDFICCSEAIEHFHQPHKEWQLWQRLLRPGGVLGIMTKRVVSAEAFRQWHYKNDPTHVSFFSEQTFNWLAARDNLEVQYADKDVVLLTKRA